jgi:hypothetical protein
VNPPGSATTRAGLAYDLPAVPLAIADLTGQLEAQTNSKTSNTFVFVILGAGSSEAVRLIMEVPGGHDLGSVLRHQRSILVEDKGDCCRGEAQGQQAAEGEQQLPHGDDCWAQVFSEQGV